MFFHTLNDLNGASLSKPRSRWSVDIQTRNWRQTGGGIQEEFLLHSDSTRTWWATVFQWKLTIFEFISSAVTFCVSQRGLERVKSGRAQHHRGPSPTTPASWRSSDGFSRERSATSCSTLRPPSLRYSPVLTMIVFKKREEKKLLWAVSVDSSLDYTFFSFFFFF